MIGEYMALAEAVWMSVEGYLSEDDKPYAARAILVQFGLDKLTMAADRNKLVLAARTKAKSDWE